MLGKGYVIECCVDGYLREQAERRRHAYVADALMAIAENTARFAGGMKMTGRWSEEGRGRDRRTGDDIAAAVMRNAGLKWKTGKG